MGVWLQGVTLWFYLAAAGVDMAAPQVILFYRTDTPERVVVERPDAYRLWETILVGAPVRESLVNRPEWQVALYWHPEPCSSRGTCREELDPGAAEQRASFYPPTPGRTGLLHFQWRNWPVPQEALDILQCNGFPWGGGGTAPQGPLDCRREGVVSTGRQ